MKRRDAILFDLGEVMEVVMLVMGFMGTSSMSMIMQLRSVERQGGIPAAGVDGTHERRVMQPLSVRVMRSMPKVGCLPMVLW